MLVLFKSAQFTIFPEYLPPWHWHNGPLLTIKLLDKHQLSDVRFELEKLKVGQSIAIVIDVDCAWKFNISAFDILEIEF